MKVNRYQNNCPVCGLDWGSSIYEIDSSGIETWESHTAFSICKICFVEYDNEVFPNDELSNMKYRLKWLRAGLPLHFPTHSFHLAKTQDPKYIEHLIENCIRLKNIDIDFTKKETVEEYKKEIPNIEEIIKPYIDMLDKKESNSKN
jgi:hypothetical protein